MIPVLKFPSMLFAEMEKLSEYLLSMNLDGYSFELFQERVDKWETVG